MSVLCKSLLSLLPIKRASISTDTDTKHPSTSASLESGSASQPTNKMSFPYKTVLMVGATSGIGLGMAEKLVREGSKVIAVGRRQDRIDDFIKKHGSSRVDGVAYDINDSQNLRNFVQNVTSKNPDLDCVFLNAGVQGVYDFTKPDRVDLEAFHKEVSVNFTSFVNISTAFLPFLQAKTTQTSIV